MRFSTLLLEATAFLLGGAAAQTTKSYESSYIGVYITDDTTSTVSCVGDYAWVPRGTAGQCCNPTNTDNCGYGVGCDGKDIILERDQTWDCGDEQSCVALTLYSTSPTGNAAGVTQYWCTKDFPNTIVYRELKVQASTTSKAPTTPTPKPKPSSTPSPKPTSTSSPAPSSTTQTQEEEEEEEEEPEQETPAPSTSSSTSTEAESTTETTSDPPTSTVESQTSSSEPIIPTPPNADSAASNEDESSQGSPNKAWVVGPVVGGIAAVGLLAIFAIVFIRRRKSKQPPPPAISGPIQRGGWGHDVHNQPVTAARIVNFSKGNSGTGSSYGHSPSTSLPHTHHSDSPSVSSMSPGTSAQGSMAYGQMARFGMPVAAGAVRTNHDPRFQPPPRTFSPPRPMYPSQELSAVSPSSMTRNIGFMNQPPQLPLQQQQQQMQQMQQMRSSPVRSPPVRPPRSPIEMDASTTMRY